MKNPPKNRVINFWHCGRCLAVCYAVDKAETIKKLKSDGFKLRRISLTEYQLSFF